MILTELDHLLMKDSCIRVGVEEEDWVAGSPTTQSLTPNTSSQRQGTEEEGSMGMRWMPWRRVPMKDVVSCDKPRGAASEHRSGGFRMGQPAIR